MISDMEEFELLQTISELAELLAYEKKARQRAEWILAETFKKNPTYVESAAGAWEEEHE
jgi:hypothetical protein